MEYYKINCELSGEWSTTLINGIDTLGKKMLILCPVGIRNMKRSPSSVMFFPLDKIMRLIGRDYHKYQYTLYTTAGIIELNSIDAVLQKIPIEEHAWHVCGHTFPIAGSTIIVTRIKDIINNRMGHMDLASVSSKSGSSKVQDYILSDKNGSLSLKKKKNESVKFNLSTYVFT